MEKLIIKTQFLKIAIFHQFKIVKVYKDAF